MMCILVLSCTALVASNLGLDKLYRAWLILNFNVATVPLELNLFVNACFLANFCGENFSLPFMRIPTFLLSLNNQIVI